MSDYLIQGGADKLGQNLCLFLNSITGVNKYLELCNFDCAFVYAPRIRWHDVTTISSSNLLDSAREACARAPDLQRRNDRRCSPNGPRQTNGVTIVVIIGLLLHHARTSLVAWAEARAARGPYPFRHELGCPPLPEIFPLPSCSTWFHRWRNVKTRGGAFPLVAVQLKADDTLQFFFTHI